METNAYYFSRLSPIGGIETFLYQLAKKYTKKDITFYYKSADLAQLKRLSKYVNCKVYTEGTKIVCDKFFCNFNLDPIKNGDVTANEKILVVHGNYDWVGAQHVPQHPDIDRVVAVSRDASEAYTRLTGIPCEVCYNPLELDEPNKVLTLMSATRLDLYSENIKGTGRIEKLLEALDRYCEANGTDYYWMMFSTLKPINHPKLLYFEPRLDLTGFMLKCDYGVQLSDNVEGFNYTTNEFLCAGIPMVLTPCNVYKECKIDGSMAIFLDFDCSNIDEVVEKMFNSRLNVSYKPPKDGWDKLLATPKKPKKVKKLELIRVIATDESEKRHVKIAELNRIAKKGEVFETTPERAEQLRGDNPYKVRFIE